MYSVAGIDMRVLPAPAAGGSADGSFWCSGGLRCFGLVVWTLDSCWNYVSASDGFRLMLWVCG